MNELEEHCSWIENLKYIDNCSNLWMTLCLQSTTYCFLRRMEEHEDFKKLLSIASSGEQKLNLWERAWRIWNSSCDPNYAHHDDIFLAIYLNALSKIDGSDHMISGLIHTVAHTKSRCFFNSKCVAQSIWDKKHKDVPVPTNTVLVRCRVCNSMTDGKRCVIYKYTSRYTGDSGVSAPKLFSLCEDCLREGLDSINEKCTG